MAAGMKWAITLVWHHSAPQWPLLHMWIDLNSSMHYIHYKVWDEISSPSLNFNGATVEI